VRCPAITIRSDNLLPRRLEDTDFGAVTILRRVQSLAQRTESNARRAEKTEPGREQQHADSRREASAAAFAAQRSCFRSRADLFPKPVVARGLVGCDKNNRTIRSRHAAHRATKYPIGRLLSASSISTPTSPDASPRTIAPGAPGLKLRNTPVVTFRVTIGAFGQARP
jgi:hypothetical protein